MLSDMRVKVAIKLKKMTGGQIQKAKNIERALMMYCITKGGYTSNKDCPGLISDYECERNKLFGKLTKYPKIFSDKTCLSDLVALENITHQDIQAVIETKEFTPGEKGLNLIYRRLGPYNIKDREATAMALNKIIDPKNYDQQVLALIRMIDKSGDFYTKYGPRFVDLFLKGEAKIDLSQPEAIFPEIFEKENKKIKDQLEQKIVDKTSTLYECPQCHKRQSKSHIQQNRSLDEEATIICVCLNCGKTFRGH